MKNIIPKNYKIIFEPNLDTASICVCANPLFQLAGKQTQISCAQEPWHAPGFSPRVLDKFKCLGREEIEIKILKPVSSITLNSAEIEIGKCSVAKGKEILIPKVKFSPEKEEVAFLFSKKISGEVALKIEFTSEINNKLKGLYRSSYKYKGKTKYLATTQFEAADARRAFPCFDEPEAKATFDISILAPSSFDAISNMNILRKKKVGNKTLYVFAKTPKMSTYLIYLGVGEFEYLRGKLGKIKIRVVTTKGKKSRARLALKLTKQFLNYYQSYFKIRYPLPKLDMIAVPDFEAGAMENWGAITFRETALLYDDKTSSTATKHWIAEVVAHELAHQWFGNLTTMKWWNDLWLNESFATFMATKAVDSIYPNWDFWDQFMSSSVSAAYSLDSLKTSHPINVEVRNPSEIGEIFDAISYEKGGSILRMLENFVGEKKFQKGLKVYLTRHKYSNTASEDLWNALSETSDKPIREIMKSWTEQIGYPMINVKSGLSKLSLNQKRFLQVGESSSKSVWKIPLSISIEGKLISEIMNKKFKEIRFPAGNWVKINSEEKGFYRVKYDKSALKKLKEPIENKNLDSADRWGIHSDLFSFCVSGDYSIKDYLDFVKIYSDEKNFLVLNDLNSSLYYLYILSFGEEFNKKIKEFGLEHFRRVFERIGWDEKHGEKPTVALLRSHVVGILGQLGDVEILEEAKGRFKKFQRNPLSLNSNLRSTVYNLVAWQGDSKIQDLFFSLYRKASTEEEKGRLLSAICNFRDKKLLLKALEFSLSDEVKTQSIHVPIARISKNPYGKSLVWHWLKSNWQKINKKLGGMGAPLLRRMVEGLVFATDSESKEIREFFRQNPSPLVGRALKQTLEKIEINLRFLERMRRDFRE